MGGSGLASRFGHGGWVAEPRSLIEMPTSGGSDGFCAGSRSVITLALSAATRPWGAIICNFRSSGQCI